MPSVSTKSKPAKFSMKCDFCAKKFTLEGAFIKHTCLKKKRYACKDEKVNKMAYQCFVKAMTFYNVGKKGTPPSEMKFVTSSLYLYFMRFAEYLIDINVINYPNFIKFLIDNKVHTRKWNLPKYYSDYITDMIKRETPDAAIERSLMQAQRWADDNKMQITDFFKHVSPPQALIWIETGRISPWFIFLSSTSADFYERLSEEQSVLIDRLIPAKVWGPVIDRHKTKNIREVLSEAGL